MLGRDPRLLLRGQLRVGDEVVADEVLGLLAVNGWHNLVHMTIGALLLIAAGGAARPAALFVGVLYLVLAVARASSPPAETGSASSPRTAS